MKKIQIYAIQSILYVDTISWGWKCILGSLCESYIHNIKFIKLGDENSFCWFPILGLILLTIRYWPWFNDYNGKIMKTPAKDIINATLVTRNRKYFVERNSNIPFLPDDFHLHTARKKMSILHANDWQPTTYE